MDGQDTDQAALVDQILDVIAKEGLVDRDRITMDATLEDLQIKSMDVVIILTGIEEKFSVYIPVDGPLAEAKNVRDFVGHVVEQIRAQKA
jgi:acyl carrier protein